MPKRSKEMFRGIVDAVSLLLAATLDRTVLAIEKQFLLQVLENYKNKLTKPMKDLKLLF